MAENNENGQAEVPQLEDRKVVGPQSLRIAGVLLLVWFLAIAWGFYHSFGYEKITRRYCFSEEKSCNEGSIGKISGNCIYECPSPTTVDDLIQGLRTNNTVVRRDAAGALEQVLINSDYDKERVVDSLVEALKTNDRYVQYRVVQALKKIGTEKALEAVEGFSMRSNKIRVRGMGRRAVDKEKQSSVPQI